MHHVQFPHLLFGQLVVQQPKIGNSVFRAYFSHHKDINEDANLSKLLASTWRMETYGTCPELTLSIDKKYALETRGKTITFTEGRYQIGLL